MTLVMKAEKDGKIRINSMGWDEPVVLLPDQALGRNFSFQLPRIVGGGCDPLHRRVGHRFALINSLGNVGGFASTFVVGWLTDLTHSTSASLYLFAGLSVIGALLLLTVPARMINK